MSYLHNYVGSKQLQITFLKMSEWMEVLHGKMTNGKLTATDKTKPILTNSTRLDGGKAVKMFPEKSDKFCYKQVTRFRIMQLIHT